MFMMETSVNAAMEAARRGVRAFVHMSSGREYTDGIGKEDSPMKSFSLRSSYMLKTEKAVMDVPNLNGVVFRTPVQFGFGHAGVYAQIAVFLFILTRANFVVPVGMAASQRRDVIHLEDAARAMLHAAEWCENREMREMTVYNISIPVPTIMDTICAELQRVFPKWKYEYIETPDQAPSDEVAEQTRQDVNEAALNEWLTYLEVANIQNCPISPVFSVEDYNLRAEGIDGSAFTRDTGFTYKHERFAAADFETSIDEYVDAGIFPKDWRE